MKLTKIQLCKYILIIWLTLFSYCSVLYSEAAIFFHGLMKHTVTKERKVRFLQSFHQNIFNSVTVASGMNRKIADVAK